MNSTIQKVASIEIKNFDKISTSLEQKKGNILRPSSLKPNRSVKKSNSLKPVGLKNR